MDEFEKNFFGFPFGSFFDNRELAEIIGVTFEDRGIDFVRIPPEIICISASLLILQKKDKLVVFF